METIKANNREQCLKQLGNLADEVGAKIPEQVNENEKGYYHVAIVTRQHIADQETYNTYVNLQKFRPEVWDRYNREEKGGQSAFKRSGIKNMVIYHNPTKKTTTSRATTAKKD